MLCGVKLSPAHGLRKAIQPYTQRARRTAAPSTQVRAFGSCETSGLLMFTGQGTMSLRLVTPPTMPSADFSRLISAPLDADSLAASHETSPGKTHSFHAYACRIFRQRRICLWQNALPSVQVPDFSVTCHLIRHRRLVCGFCSSGQRFATGFLQTPPHDDALAFR